MATEAHGKIRIQEGWIPILSFRRMPESSNELNNNR